MGESVTKKDKEIRVLLVDDDRDFAQLMSHWLQQQGCSITVAYGGEEGIKKIKEDAPDIVFLDVIMPNMDGFTALRKIREFNSTLPVILMSSYLEDRGVGKKSNAFGMSGFFGKGDEFSRALTLLHEALKIDKK